MNLTDFVLKITGQADRMEASEKNLSSVVDKLSAALATVEAKDAQILDLSAKLEAAPKAEAIAALEAEKLELTSKLTVAEAEVLALPEKVNAEAARIVASNGFTKPISTSGKQDQPAKTKTHAEFSALSPREKSAFMRSGGTLTE